MVKKRDSLTATELAAGLENFFGLFRDPGEVEKFLRSWKNAGRDHDKLSGPAVAIGPILTTLSRFLQGPSGELDEDFRQAAEAMQYAMPIVQRHGRLRT